mmetsp:Transcript_64611/g.192486  ORF Transcript_64611/g.192486 Transcript_64611/m.192486 type:complete len:564 (-) Transcript_64611:12-1703(-)
MEPWWQQVSGRSKALELHVPKLLFGCPEDRLSVLEQDHLVQGLPGRDHGQTDVRNDLEVHQHGAVMGKPLLDDTRQFLFGRALSCFNAMGLCQLHKVGVHVVHAHVAPVEEESLPDPDHLLPRIVHDRDLDWQVVPLDGLQVHARHVEGTITINEDSQGLGVSHLRPYCEGEPHTHNAQAAAGDHAPRPRPSYELGGHHLVVPHACADKDLAVVHPAALVEEGVRGLDDLLGLDHAVWGLDVAEGMVLLPLHALLLPCLALGDLWRRDEPLHGLQSMLSVGPDGHGGLHNLPEGCLVDVDVDDAAHAIPLRHPCLWRVLVHDAGGAVVEAAPDRDDAVCVLDCKVCVRGPVHAEHVHGERVPLVEDAHPVDSGGHRDLRLCCHLAQDVWTMARPLADVEDGALRTVDYVHRLLDALHVNHGRGISRCQSRRPKDRRWDLCPHGHDVLRQVYVAGTRATGGGDPERLVDGPGQLVEVQADVVPLRARARDLGRGALLEGVGAHGAGRHLPGEDDHGDAVRQGVLQRGHQVGDAGPARHDGDPDPPRRLCIRCGGVAAALLVRRC